MFGLAPESAVTGKAPKKVPASSGVKKAEPKPVRPASRSPDAVARVASLEAVIALGDHDDQVRKSLEEVLAKAKKSANVASVGVRLNSAMKIHRAHPEEGGKKGRRDCQEGRGSSSFAVSASRGDGKFARSRGPIGLSAEAAPPAPPSVDVEAEFRRMQRVIDALQAELARFRSKEIRATESDEEDRGVLVTNFAAIQEESADGSRNAAQSFGHWWSGRRPIRTLIDQGDTAARESGYRSNPSRQSPEIRDMVSGRREWRRRRTQVLSKVGFPIGTGGKG